MRQPYNGYDYFSINALGSGNWLNNAQQARIENFYLRSKPFLEILISNEARLATTKDQMGGG